MPAEKATVKIIDLFNHEQRQQLDESYSNPFSVTAELLWQ